LLNTTCKSIRIQIVLLQRGGAEGVRRWVGRHVGPIHDGEEKCNMLLLSRHWVTIFPLKPSFKLGFKPNFGLKPN